MSPCGTSRRFAATQQFSRFRSEADIQRAALTEPPWPTQKMEEFYSELLCRQPDAPTPWKIWVDHYNEAKVNDPQPEFSSIILSTKGRM
jgi:hypothetical protein